MSIVTTEDASVNRTRFTAEVSIRTPEPTAPTQVIIVRKELVKVGDEVISNKIAVKHSRPLDQLLDRTVNVNGVMISGAQVAAWIQATADELDTE